MILVCERPACAPTEATGHEHRESGERDEERRRDERDRRHVVDAWQSSPQVAKSFAPRNSLVIAANAAIQTTTATANSTSAAVPSRPRIHAAASTPQVSAKSATITTWTTHVDIDLIVV